MACEQTLSAASNDERRKDSKRIDVMFLCDEWKSSKGGLSTFNREFAVNLAKTASDSIKVHCYVAQSDELSREDARQHRVNLITARSIPGSSDPLDWLKIPPPELRNPDIVVGHGRKFGTPAYFIVQIAKCKWMHFVHVFCEDLGKFKATPSAAVDAIEENEKKHKNEIELCKAADVVVAVGSRLQQKYGKCLPHVKVEIITPGILEKFSNESNQLVKDKSMVIAKKFKVFMFGRASFEDLTLKGYDIVANAIGSLDKMFELTFVGSSPGEHRKIEQWFLDNTCISRSQITIRSYCSEQDELKMMFHESDVITLPSRTEGFGLVALEAISAGIPVLVAGESGIAEALHEVEGGQSVIVDSDDSEEWARRIQQLSSQSPEERENDAKLLRDNYNKTYPWSNECERFKRMIQDLAQSLNALKLKIDVETMTPREHNTQDRTPALTEEPGGSQNGQHQEACAIAVPSGHTQPSCAGAEATQAGNPIPTEGEVLRLLAVNYLQTTPPRCKADRDAFVEYMKEMGLIITGVRVGSLLITVKCDSLQILETLWEDYSSGHLGEVVQRCFVTEEILTKLSLAELKLQTTISEEEYKACKMYLGKDPAKEADETDDDDDSTSSDEDQCGSVPVPVEQPVYVHFTDVENLSQRDEVDDSRTETVGEKPKTESDEGSSVSDDEGILSGAFSFDSPIGILKGMMHDVAEMGLEMFDVSSPKGLRDYLAYLTREMDRAGILPRAFSLDPLSGNSEGRVYQIVEKGLEMFDVSSPKGLRDYLAYFTDEMDSAGLLRTRGSVAEKPFSTWERPSKKGGHTRTSREEQSYTEEGKIPREGGSTGDQPTASSSGSDLQGDVKLARSVVMQKTSKPVRESHSAKHLTEAMDDAELRQFLRIQVKEGKWQVVILCLDEMLRRDRGDTDEDAGSGDLKSRTLTWWLAEYQDLVILRKVLTESNYKLNSLKLGHSVGITARGVKHIAKALSNSNCQLNSLNLSESNVTDKGVKHIAEALSNSNCQLNSLNLSRSYVTDEGAKHMAEALSNRNCQLNSLNLSGSDVTDKGVKHIAEALSNRNCQLNSLNLSWNNITDKGVKHIAEALSNSNCQLNSLNLSEGSVTDKGVKHIAEALSSSNCQLNSLDLSVNLGITDEGVKYLAEALEHSNYKLKSFHRFSIKVTTRVKGQVSEEGLS